MTADLSRIKHVVLDMDGTIYLGGALFPESLPFLNLLERLKVGYTFITNNCSRSRAQYVNHLGELGIDVAPEAIHTSAQATIRYLQTRLPRVQRLFVLGTVGLKDDFRQAGFGIVEDRPETIIVGFDLNLNYERLARTAWWITQGLPYVATHPDRVCPTNEPTVLPDCGAICALLDAATGRRPDAVPGKPNPAMLQAIMQEQNLTSEVTAMVGDRLYTDIRMAREAGALAILTLTGEAGRYDVDAAPADWRPHLVVKDLGELGRMIAEARDA